MDKRLGTYLIDYGKGITQVKDLIPQADYDDIRGRITELEIAKKTKEAEVLKKELNAMFGDSYFTTESPLGLALKNGILSLPLAQGGDQPCKITPIA